MAATEYELVSERLVAVADVPYHGTAEHEREQHMYFGSRSTGVSALPVVQRDVDELIHQVGSLFPVGTIYGSASYGTIHHAGSS